MTKLICDVCGVNDYIVYILTEEGTFCSNCYEFIKYSFPEGEVCGGNLSKTSVLKHDPDFPTMTKESQPRTVNLAGI